MRVGSGGFVGGRPLGYLDGRPRGASRLGDAFLEAPFAGRQTIVPAAMTFGSIGTPAAAATTASVTPVANVPMILAVSSYAAGVNPPTVAGLGLTWVRIGAGIIYNASRTDVYRASGPAPTAGTITITCGTGGPYAMAWTLIKLTGADSSGTGGSGAVVQTVTATGTGVVTTRTTTLAALESASNINLTFVGLQNNALVTHDPTFAELTDNFSSYGISIESQWALNKTTCTPTWSSVYGGLISLEIKGAA